MSSASAIALVTGASGLLGSHIAERLVARGVPVRALVRRSSNTRFLESLGVEILRGALGDRKACLVACRGVSMVYHAAAKVGDWGNWEEFQTGCLDSTRTLARAAIEAGVQRFLHISSTSAYGHPTEGGSPVTETAPLGLNLWRPWDHYTRSKVESERILWDLRTENSLPLPISRPSWLYGERDRTTTARLVARIQGGGIPLIGRGDNPLSAIYAGEVAEAAILAANDPSSEGEAYNVTDLGPITQRDYFAIWAEACGKAPSVQTRSYPVVFAAALGLEAFGKLVGRRQPPLITRYATWLMGRNLAYDSTKARERLGWKPALDYRESIDRTVKWYREGAGPTAPSLTTASNRSSTPNSL